MHVEVSSEEYVVFGVVLFLWELVPTTFVVLFFRAQRLSQNLVGLSELLQLKYPCAGGSLRCLVCRIRLLKGCQKSHVWLNSLLFNRLQQEWSIVTATAPEPTSLTIQGAMTVMMTCHGLGPEKEGKCFIRK